MQAEKILTFAIQLLREGVSSDLWNQVFFIVEGRMGRYVAIQLTNEVDMIGDKCFLPETFDEQVFLARFENCKWL